MKKLKRLKISEMSEFRQLTELEMQALIGGTGCCWEAMAYAAQTLYGEKVEPSYFARQWEDWLSMAREQGCENAELAKDGDPTMAQTGYLLGFLQQYFKASGSWKKGSVPINSNGCGYAIMKSDGSADEHAVFVIGYDYADSANREKYYKTIDPTTGDVLIVNEKDIIGGVSLENKYH